MPEVRCKSARSSIFFFAIFLSALRSRRLNAFTAKVAKNAQRTQRNLRISSYRLGILILHSEFSLLHSDFRPSPVISRRKPLDLPYDHADPQRSCESFLRLSALCLAPADLLARVGRRSVCHGPAGEQTHPARHRRRVVPLVPCDGSRIVRRPGNCPDWKITIRG